MPASRLLSLIFGRASTYPILVKVVAVVGYTLALLLFFGLFTGMSHDATDIPQADGPIVQVRYEGNRNDGTIRGTAVLQTRGGGLSVTAQGEGTISK